MNKKNINTKISKEEQSYIDILTKPFDPAYFYEKILSSDFSYSRITEDYYLYNAQTNKYESSNDYSHYELSYTDGSIEKIRIPKIFSYKIIYDPQNIFIQFAVDPRLVNNIRISEGLDEKTKYNDLLPLIIFDKEELLQYSQSGLKKVEIVIKQAIIEHFGAFGKHTSDLVDDIIHELSDLIDYLKDK